VADQQDGARHLLDDTAQVVGVGCDAP
jgi:hypothetical protein